ncbi:MAG: 50S ribosomal protein L4 [Deltaproteobacteria bacterium CG11_big_fil_rev_8_21_14_0_20_42_23]|nr:MAG: 50S ribosomal protein L4 [Deltaproteobacteria bacterium CG11_big_fil_rev_8_21_14_0_20_42_23]PJC64636.1 MAG: 50S ribosomal protein L4 [Deltaproteobacteria bacterium CG_4_9_14_0_2_um_filter_42_21]
MKQTVLDKNKKKVGELELSDAVFACEVNVGLVYDHVKQLRASARAGSASTINPANMRGTGAKMYRQKGTGRARHGSAKKNIFVGGGVVHGPTPRSYAYKMPTKAKRASLKSALTIKTQEEKVLVLDALNFKAPKTKEMISLLNALGVKSALLVLDAPQREVELSARNVPHLKVVYSNGLNSYDLLRYEHVVFTKAAVEKAQEVLQS